MKTYLNIEDISSYKMATTLSDLIYSTVTKWPWFDKQTTGTQLVRAADSIAANIAEGFGRYHKKDKIKFYYNARGSTFEVAHWIQTAIKRKLIRSDTHGRFLSLLQALPKEINTLIALTNKNLKN